MIKINAEKTLKELREKGFKFSNCGLLYEIKPGIYLVFELNDKMDKYLCFIGEECLKFCKSNLYEKEKEEALQELRDSGFVIDVKC